MKKSVEPAPIHVPPMPYHRHDPDTVAAWSKTVAHVNGERFVRVPERFIKRGALNVVQEPAMTHEDVTAWLDLDATTI